MTDTYRVPQSRTLEAVIGGRARPSEVVTAALERLDATEPDLRAWVRIDRAGALSTARELDERPNGDRSAAQLPLRGVPFGVKDIIDVRDTPTECGSPLRRGRIAGADAWVVDRLRQAGAIPLGKTVTTEFAYFAPGPTRNPHDLTRTPGGSSSGSAAAVAAGVVPLALGSQTAGSLTRPAAFCGVAGFVAPVGSWPTTGIAGLSHSLDSVGLITPSVADLRLVHGVLSGPQERPMPYECRPRLRVWTGSELGDVDASMRAAVARAAEAEEADADDLGWAARTPGLVDAHTTIMAYEAARALAEEGRHPDRLSAALGELLALGRRITESDYRSALSTAARARADILTVLTDADALLGPAALGPAPHGLAATGTPVLSRPWQLLGLPVVTVPGYIDDEAMPLGLQLIGHPDRVDRLFAIGEQLERLARETPPPKPAKNGSRGL